MPKTIEDVDRVDLGNVVQTATPKLFNKLLKDFTKDSGVKVRQIGKNQSKFIYQMVCSVDYKAANSL